jgi:hypothetical protein
MEYTPDLENEARQMLTREGVIVETLDGTCLAIAQKLGLMPVAATVIPEAITEESN